MPLSRSLAVIRTATVTTIAGGALLAAPAAATINIPDGGTVQQGSVSVITFRVLDGCDGDATDAIEVTIPASVQNVQPQAVPGWVVELEYDDGEISTDGSPTGDRTVAVVRWTGGVLPANQFGDFGMRAIFPDEETAIAFPTIQRCGDASIDWSDDNDGALPAPTVAVGPDVNAREEVRIANTVQQLEADVAALQDELSGVDPSNLRSRVRDVEDRIPELAERLGRLAERLDELDQGDDG